MVEEKKPPKKSEFVVHTLDEPTILSRVTTWVSTGCMPLDYILGGKGCPVRRIVEIYGDNSTGKSLIAASLCAETQAMKGMAAYADTEVAQDPARLEVLGINPKTLLIDYPNTLDGVFEYLEYCIKYRDKKLGKEAPLTFVWDSVAAIATMAELERSEKEGLEGKQYPDVARALSVALRQWVNRVAVNNVLLFITNQTREKLGQMWGDGVTTTGGRALRFYASMRIELQTMGRIKEGNRIIGANVKATSVKNRLAAPYQTTLLPLYYKYGIDEAESTLEYFIDQKVIQHEKGAIWYAIDLDGKETKFQKKGWNQIFLDNYKLISDMFNNGLHIQPQEVTVEEVT